MYLVYILNKKEVWRGDEQQDVILPFLKKKKSKPKLQFVKHEMVEANNACGAERRGEKVNVYSIKLSLVPLKRKLGSGDRYPRLRLDLLRVFVHNETNIVFEP